MIHTYSQFINSINEGTSSNPEIIYWNSQLENLLNKHWSNISTKKYTSDIYEINFKVEGLNNDNKYTYYAVLVGKGEKFMMEDSTKFVEKFKVEFWNNSGEYIDNMKYKPKCLGDLTSVVRSKKSNLFDLK